MSSWLGKKVITGQFEELKLGEFINPLKAEYSAILQIPFQDIKNGQSIIY